jgi:hypothetical protein
VTLFYDGEIYSDGAIGIAPQPSFGHTSLAVEFPGLVGLTSELKVTRYLLSFVHPVPC